MDYGIKISVPGVDVKSAKPEELVYSSKYSNLKIFEVLTASISFSKTDTFNTKTVTIPNPLPYSPMFMAFAKQNVVMVENDRIGWHCANGNSMVEAIVNYNSKNNTFLCQAPGMNVDNFTIDFRVVVFVDMMSGQDYSPESTGDCGVKISKDTHDITGKDTEMSFDSKYQNLTIEETGFITDTVVNGTGFYDGTAIIDHNLGYVPIVMVFMQHPLDSSKYSPMPTWFDDGSHSGQAMFSDIIVTEKQLILAKHSVASIYASYKYIIFNEAIV